MPTNVGQTERVIRIVAGLLILAAGAYFQSWLGLIGLVPLATGAIGTCPTCHLVFLVAKPLHQSQALDKITASVAAYCSGDCT